MLSEKAIDIDITSPDVHLAFMLIKEVVVTNPSSAGQKQVHSWPEGPGPGFSVMSD
jgi:hypothetical protein